MAQQKQQSKAKRKVAKPKSKAKSKAKTVSTRADPTVRRHGLYENSAKQCAEITTQRGRCKLGCIEGTMFCNRHQRRRQQHEDKFFDSTFARVDDGIWIGSLDTANDPKALRSAGIKGIVNISGWEPRQKTRDMYRLWKPKPIKYFTTTTRDSRTGRLRYLGDEPIRDRRGLASFYDYMDRGVEMVAKCPKPCLINCHAGINRSASLVAAYLMSKRGMTFNQARELLEKANRKRDTPVLTNRYFVDAMKRYGTHLRQRHQR